MRAITITLFIIALCAMDPSYVHARLGETAEQCATRYGRPTSLSPSLFDRDMIIGQYYKDDISIRVYFEEGRAGAIRFNPIKTDAQVQKLLDANAQASTWKEIPHKRYRKWSRSDGGDAEHVGVELLVRSGEAVAAKAAKRKRKEQTEAAAEAARRRSMEALDGF